MLKLLDRALTVERARGLEFEADPSAIALLAKAADGDGRRALNMLELAIDLATADETKRLSTDIAGELAAGGLRRFDNKGEAFYEQISALHKSVRGSDPDAALYWLCRMLDGGCDPRYVARRVLRMASEDIGNADPRALTLALEACEVYELPWRNPRCVATDPEGGPTWLTSDERRGAGGAIEPLAQPWFVRSMCNDYEQHVSQAQYAKAIAALELAGSDADQAALVVADDIRIGDIGPVLRAAGNGVELVGMRFGFPPPRPKAGPIFNFKSDGRDFAESRRCVVVLSGFFEFTGSKYPKAKHRFALKDSQVMGIAGLWSEDKDGALSFTMLTTAPGPDIAPIHDRQVCVLHPRDWAAWLFLTRPETELLRPLPQGTLVVETVRPGAE